jgi:transposase
VAGEYWLGDEAWAAIDPLLPKVYAGARRKDDRRIISGIIHVLRSGCRWIDCPAVYGPHTTVYNRFNRWSRRGRFQAIFDTLVQIAPKDKRSIDSTSIKVQRSAAGGKGGQQNRPSAVRAVAGRPRSTPSRTAKVGCSASR